MLSTIVSDQDPTFTIHFWQYVFKLQGTHLNMSLAYYPQIHKKKHIITKCLEMYL